MQADVRGKGVRSLPFANHIICLQHIAMHRACHQHFRSHDGILGRLRHVIRLQCGPIPVPTGLPDFLCDTGIRRHSCPPGIASMGA